MISFRKHLYQAVLRLNRPRARALRFMRTNQWLSREQVEQLRQQRLQQILEYSYRHVPYYRTLFLERGVAESGSVRAERLARLPVLDKATIRAHSAELVSDQAGELHSIENRTSGSTGEPLTVLQDRDGNRITGAAVLSLFYEWHGVEAGEREIKLWGSGTDLVSDSAFSVSSLREWASGIVSLNAFRMTPERMHAYIEIINRYRPKVLRGYSSNLHELAVFAAERGLKIVPPGLIVSSAGTLYAALREKMESVFGCHVFNHYGSREMHNMAMECPSRGMHMSAFTHFIEVLDDQDMPCAPGVEGDLVVTSLLNFAMPLIRYRIGDRGALSESTCPCGRGLPMLSKLSGRSVECFRTVDGRIVPGEYFIYLLGVRLTKDVIAKFQVWQEDYDSLWFRLVLQPDRVLDDEIRLEIEEQTRLVMGNECRIQFEFPDDIAPSSSGKYFHTLSAIERTQVPETIVRAIPSDGGPGGAS